MSEYDYHIVTEYDVLRARLWVAQRKTEEMAKEAVTGKLEAIFAHKQAAMHLNNVIAAYRQFCALHNIRNLSDEEKRLSLGGSDLADLIMAARDGGEY